MADKKAVGFLGPQEYMKPAIETMREKYDVHEMNPKGWEKEEIDELVKYCKDNNIEGVGGFAQKDAFHHILINEGLGNKVPGRLAFFYCMNKYLMRTLEKDPFWFDWVDPVNEDEDAIVAKIKEWPFMLKNTSLSLGRGIFKIKTEEDLRATIRAYKEDKPLQDMIASNNDSYSEGLDPKSLPEVVPPFIAEHLVDMGKIIEYCYEGYITPEGKIVHYAMTEEVYFANHQALGYLTPPLNLPSSKAKLVEEWVNDYMGRFVDLGYVNQFFNLEFWITEEDEIFLTEINPRAAHSFHYNYVYSFGDSLFEDNLVLASGGSLPESNPWTKWANNEDHKYTLIVLITGKQTDKVSNILDYEYVDHLENNEGILIRHTRQRDDQLTENDMTAAGVMLLQMWITGDTPHDVISKEREIRSKIYKIEQPDCDYPTYWKEG